MENIRVVLRIKPIVTADKAKGDFPCIKVGASGKKIEVRVEPTRHETYKCTRFFGPGDAQAEFFDECGVKYLLDNALKGSPVCIIAFGEKGSGKSYTMFGQQRSGGANERSAGVITRSIKHIASMLAESGSKFQLSLSCVEIAKEEISDLLDTGDSGKFTLDITPQEDGSFTMDEAALIDCTDPSVVVDVIDKLNKQRATPQARKKRSHCLLTLHISVVVNGGDRNQSLVPLSTVSFVDLVDTEGLHMEDNEETDLYDHSLFVLGKVIDGIERENNDNTSVTDSVLTKLLSQSIGIRSRCLLISCIHEGDFHIVENLKTIKFRSESLVPPAVVMIPDALFCFPAAVCMFRSCRSTWIRRRS
jgi:hypothetical protein